MIINAHSTEFCHPGRQSDREMLINSIANSIASSSHGNQALGFFELLNRTLAYIYPVEQTLRDGPNDVIGEHKSNCCHLF